MSRWLAMLLLALVVPGPEVRGTATPEADSWVGRFAGDKLSVEVRPAEGAYAGTIHFGTREFPFTAGSRGAGIAGTFKSGDDAFDFTATLSGRTLTFTTGGTTYVMNKVVADVVPAISRPSTTAPAETAPAETAPIRTAPAQTAPATTAPAEHRAVISVRPAAPGTQPAAPVGAEPAVVFDAMMSCDAARLQMPDGWRSRVDVVWRANPFDPAIIAGSVSEPGGPARLTLYPRLSFIQGVRAPAGAVSYMGSEIRPPVTSPGDYVRQVILPRFRPDLIAARVILEADLPRFAHDQLPKFQSLAGVRVSASRVRLAGTWKGRPVEEEFVCTVGVVPLPGGAVTWGAECSSYRAARGQLRATLPRLRAIESSMALDSGWYAGVLEISDLMQQDAKGGADDFGRLPAYIARRSHHIDDVARGGYQRRARVLAACDRDLDAALGIAPSASGEIAVQPRGGQP